MSIESILVVLFYSAKPYLWLIALLLLIPVCSYLIKLPLSFNGSQTRMISLVVGILVALAAPYITYSKLEYVTTLTDWASLFAVLIGATIYCWVTLQLLVKGRH